MRPVKDIDEYLRDAMKLHVAGVIIHGISSDRVHLFSVAPNLAGNANLNIECLYMAFKMEFEERGMLPELHVQVTILTRSLLLCWTLVISFSRSRIQMFFDL